MSHIKYGARPIREPFVSLIFGRILFAGEVTLGVLWFVYGQQKIKNHDIAASAEPLLGAQHFIVILSIVSLFGELSRVCREGKCSPLHLHYTWLVPPLVAVPFDILTLERQMVFYRSDMMFRLIAIFALVLSASTSIWTYLVVEELKRYF